MNFAVILYIVCWGCPIDGRNLYLEIRFLPHRPGNHRVFARKIVMQLLCFLVLLICRFNRLFADVPICVVQQCFDAR